MRTDAHSLARRSDPETSKAAAREIVPALSGLQARTLDLVRAHGGSTGTELSVHAGDSDPRVINRRLTELVQDGRVAIGVTRPCRITGKRCRTYWAAEQIEEVGR